MSEQANTPGEIEPSKKYPDESLESLTLESTGADPIPPDLLSQLKLRLKLHGGAEIEIPLDEIDMGSARYRSRFQREGAETAAPAARFARCGNCFEKLPLTGDAEKDHHAAMRHKQVCRTNTVAAELAYSQDQYHQLIREHAAQPMQVEFRAREAMELAAAEERERLQLTGPETTTKPATPRRWWQFWRW